MVGVDVLMSLGLTLWHLGALHPVEKAVTLVLAFGPVLVLAIVVVLRRRADDAAAHDPDAVPADAPTGRP
ncbi:hypothetical protein [Nocardioides sp. R-C-SC26]|uniref:hypothetical protein n=1 Tax=Nocardioides sp. R-C-SC26 TaxID=2870414 RepID=UPI001E4CC452|nr:hypothetical protein [Nocardioides sp. R-C-SC26]